VYYEQDSRVKTIKDFISALPYIIRVTGNAPFHTVHADMPMDDEELQNRIDKNNYFLSEEEKEYATWAREGKGRAKNAHNVIKNTGRGPASTITYVGHTIVADGLAPVVRNSTNTVNLDVAAYVYGVSLVVDHTAKTCYYLGPNAENIKHNHHLMSVLEKLALHLRAQK
jgi:hypothetical protein